MKSLNPLILFLFVLVTLESYVHVFLLKEDAVSASWLYLFSGILIGLIVLAKKRTHPNSNTVDSIGAPRSLPWFSIGVLILSAFALPHLSEAFSAVPLDYHRADMLPIMQVMSERFLSGANPYAPIPEIWDGMQPIYLPAMWLPYLPAIAMDFDMRWMGVLVLVLGCVSLSLGRGQRLSLGLSLLTLIPLGLLFYGLTLFNSEVLTLTEEGLVFGFYLLLASAIYRDKLGLMILALTLCMMSRYSLVIWAVMWVVLMFLYEDKKKGLRLAFISAACALVLLAVTRGIAYLDVFISLSGEYLEDIQSPDHRWKIEPVVKKGLGLAKFYNYEDLPQLHSWFFGVLVALPVLLLGIYSRFRSRLDRRFFLLGSLKLCLLGFYNLLIYPLSYLFYTSTFLSVALLYFYVVESRKR